MFLNSIRPVVGTS